MAINTSRNLFLLAAALGVLWNGKAAGQGELIDCISKFAKLDFDHTYFDRYNEFFHDDSIVTLAESGNYKGADAIREYVGFTQAKTSPYVKHGPESDSSFIFKMEGSNCVALTYHRHDYVFDGETASDVRVGASVMTKIYYDPEENYIPRMNAYYAKPFLEFFFDQLLNSEQTMNFLCNQVMEKSCGFSVPNCQEKLAALPTLTEGGYADGNSRACRVVHGAFALSNLGHCAHVAFDPTPDANGAIKCNASSNIAISDLFTDDDLLQYMEWSEAFGINGTMGYTMEPYYRTFKREFVDAIQYLPPRSLALQVLAIPGTPKNIQKSDPPKCPSFQNDAAYWTDIAAIELSNSYIDYIDHRQLPGERVIGPGTCTVSHVGTEGIHLKLKEMPRRLMEGSAYRTNEISVFRLNSHTFPAGVWSDGYAGLAVGAPNKDHAQVRPTLD